ncbi:MAG: hypothetical protein F4Y38_04965 [Gemmatimonadetes bacterium]|nr:hypothetical protein [Gemmatimonadota bacterium]MYG85390.1 hypothetical protein [Gemmatimonadota bacterium]MYJ89057.1 hypothetical protein [Gemmatimonadota bacterium]
MRKLHGWQRLWVFLGIFWIIIGAVAGYNEMWVVDFDQVIRSLTQPETGDPTPIFRPWEGIKVFMVFVIAWLFLYFFGMGVAWVIRGFRQYGA